MSTSLRIIFAGTPDFAARHLDALLTSGHQIVGVAAAAGFAFVASWILLKLIDKTIGLRVSADDEALGLDKGLHAEDGYVFTEPEYVVVAPAKPKKKR